MDVLSQAASAPTSPEQTARKRPALRRTRAVVLCVALTLPIAQTAHAVEIYYARAIGQEYLPDPEPPSQTPPPRHTEEPAQELPGLGARTDEEEAPKQAMSTWSKVLIGTVVVAAIAALGNGGGGGGVAVGTGDNPPPDTGSSGSGSGGGGGDSGSGSGGDGGGSGGGGGIDVGIGLGGVNGSRGNNRD